MGGGEADSRNNVATDNVATIATADNVATTATAYNVAAVYNVASTPIHTHTHTTHLGSTLCSAGAILYEKNYTTTP